jgi:AraC-like DNA-binding protein
MLHVRWTHRVEMGGTTLVYPDGCRDLLSITGPDGGTHLLLTDWDDGPRRVDLVAGTCFTGYRLRPGVLIDAGALCALAGREGDLDGFVAGMAVADPELDQIVEALARTPDKGAAISRQAGVSQRTLQRHFRDRGLPSPDFWRLLGRARRAALLLTTDRGLADIALDLGYSDQAHMTREMVRWFGRTPSRLRRDPALLAVLSQPGLGNWTGEQISTR